jgi:hypothetical protein
MKGLLWLVDFCPQKFVYSFALRCDFRKISTRLVVHTAMPVPKKSASSVHIPHASARALG